jgi:hypothetical protein
MRTVCQQGSLAKMCVRAHVQTYAHRIHTPLPPRSHSIPSHDQMPVILPQTAAASLQAARNDDGRRVIDVNTDDDSECSSSDGDDYGGGGVGRAGGTGPTHTLYRVGASAFIMPPPSEPIARERSAVHTGGGGGGGGALAVTPSHSQAQPVSAPASAEKAEVISRLRSMQQELNSLRDRNKLMRELNAAKIGGIGSGSGDLPWAVASSIPSAESQPPLMWERAGAPLTAGHSMGQLSLVMERDENEDDDDDDEGEDDQDQRRRQQPQTSEEDLQDDVQRVAVTDAEGELAWDEGGLSHVSFEHATPTPPNERDENDLLTSLVAATPQHGSLQQHFPSSLASHRAPPSLKLTVDSAVSPMSASNVPVGSRADAKSKSKSGKASKREAKAKAKLEREEEKRKRKAEQAEAKRLAAAEAAEKKRRHKEQEDLKRDMLLKRKAEVNLAHPQSSQSLAFQLDVTSTPKIVPS